MKSRQDGKKYLQTVILAGGFGKRLKPLTDNVPKPMIVVAGVPIIERQILWLKKYGVEDFIICVGYKKKAIMDYFGDGRRHHVHIQYSLEENALGTGGALKNTRQLIRGDRFLFTYGDIMTDLNVSKLTKAFDRDHYLAIMATVPLRSPFGIVEMDGDRVKAFREKPVLYDYWMNAGVFCLSRSILSILPERGSFESKTLEELAYEGKLKAVRYDKARWRSVDSHKDIEEAEKEFEHLTPSN